MRAARVFLWVCSASGTVIFCGCTAKQAASVPHPESTTIGQGQTLTVPAPLILQKNEGERRVVRGWPGHPDPGETFTIKVDPKNGGSSHLVFMTADIRPGGAIDAHRHPHSDEILFFESGNARVHLGDTVRDVRAGATVFIPAGTWISVDNIGKEPISGFAIFSAPGFEEFMRAASVREGDKNVPLTAAENDAIEKAHAGDVVYREP